MGIIVQKISSSNTSAAALGINGLIIWLLLQIMNGMLFPDSEVSYNYCIVLPVEGPAKPPLVDLVF